MAWNKNGNVRYLRDNEETGINDMYYDFTRTLKEKLYQEINGRIEYETYPSIDTVIYKVYFKDFDFAYPINNIQDRIYSGNTDEIVEDFKRCYMSSIKKAFFKTDARKRKDQEFKMGIATVKEIIV